MSINSSADPETDGALERKPAVLSRAARQRERILEAAESCFMQSGFHAASIASIGIRAKMSQGLIYRYFDNKASIVKAIIDRNLQSENFKMLARFNRANEMCRSILEAIEIWQRRDDPKLSPVLMLELTAQATRDREIARSVRDKDRACGSGTAQAVRTAARARGIWLSPAAARSRAVVLQCLIEGLGMRALRGGPLQRTALKPVLDAIVTALMS
jgi:AcrR family transcriptional regulator